LTSSNSWKFKSFFFAGLKSARFRIGFAELALRLGCGFIFQVLDTVQIARVASDQSPEFHLEKQGREFVDRYPESPANNVNSQLSLLYQQVVNKLFGFIQVGEECFLDRYYLFFRHPVKNIFNICCIFDKRSLILSDETVTAF